MGAAKRPVFLDQYESNRMYAKGVSGWGQGRGFGFNSGRHREPLQGFGQGSVMIFLSFGKGSFWFLYRARGEGGRAESGNPSDVT